MAHMIDTTTGRAAMAYVGETPWHNLGQALTPGADIETWTREAGLGYDVLESEVLYSTAAATEPQRWPARKVLHRSDTGAPLAVVSDGYKVVQPVQVMEFFRKLVSLGGFQLETAGALSDGKRVWALARIGEGAPIVGQDIVRPYLLLGTSYDGTMATIAKLTCVRVVCNNTITAVVGGYVNGRATAGERETSQGQLSSAVRVLHSEKFDADAVRAQLGIYSDSWEQFVAKTRALADRPMSLVQADEFFSELLKPYSHGRLEVRETRAYKRVLELFNGGAIGAAMPGVAGTRWAALNAVTQLIDHERGRSDSTRMESAWFGTGAMIKTRAMALLSDASPSDTAQAKVLV